MTCFDQLSELLDIDWLNLQDRQKRLILNSIDRGNALALSTRAAIEEINRLAEQQSNKVRLARNDAERERAVTRNNELNGLLTQMHMALLQSGQILPPDPKPVEMPPPIAQPETGINEDVITETLPIEQGKTNPQSNVF